MIAPTIVITALTAVGISSGKRFSIAPSTWENNTVTVSRSIGRRSPIAERIAPVAVGRAFTIFSKTGTMFSTTD